jgi:protein-disulfide isomerase
MAKGKTRTPPPPPRSSGGSRKASPKVIGGVAAVVVVVVIAVVLVIVLTGGSSTKTSVPKRGSLVGALPGAADVEKLLTGIPQSGTVLGTPGAPATMVEYVDMQCPYCREFETTVLPSLVGKYVRPGKLRIEMRVLAFIGPDSVRGRNGVVAAGLQDRAFNMAEILYANQGTENTGWLDEQMVVDAAASVPGMDVPKLVADQDTAAVAKRGDVFDAQAAAAVVRSTPTILVGKTGATPTEVALSSATDEASVAAAIDQALAG